MLAIQGRILDFVLCEAMETKWSPEIRHKCSCPLFFCKGQCKHVVVLAMLADPTTVLSPKQSDLKQVRLRAGKKHGRPAGNADSDSLDEKRKKQKEKPLSGLRRNQAFCLHSYLIWRVR